MFDSLVQPITALPSCLRGLKYNRESVDGDDIWSIPTSRWAFRTMWIAQVTTPVRRFARLHSEVCALPYLILATDWELSRDMIEYSFSHSARSILRVGQTSF